MIASKVREALRYLPIDHFTCDISTKSFDELKFSKACDLQRAFLKEDLEQAKSLRDVVQIAAISCEEEFMQRFFPKYICFPDVRWTVHDLGHVIEIRQVIGILA